MTERQPGRKRERGGITHAHAKLLFSMAWDGEVDGEQLAALQEHLRGCPECVRATDRMRAFMRTLDELMAATGGDPTEHRAP